MQQPKKSEKFMFVDPYNVGHIPSRKNDKKSSAQRMEQRSLSLAERLNGTLPNQMVLVPCNVGAHWILTVIDPYKEEIGILDPLYKGIHDGKWKQVVDVALKMFIAANNQKSVRKTPKWSIIKVPKQPDGFQCGYYVMKYMKEIINSDAVEMIDALQSLFNDKSYCILDLDHVRMEWADTVQDYMYA